MITTIKKYQTADGQLFDTWNEAYAHEVHLNRIAKIEALIQTVNSKQGETINVSELALALGTNQKNIIALLNQIIKTEEADEAPAVP